MRVALKRTLRNFGNLLGNCLYDKEYAKVRLRPFDMAWQSFLTKLCRKWLRFKSRHQNSTSPSSIAVRSMQSLLQVVLLLLVRRALDQVIWVPRLSFQRGRLLHSRDQALHLSFGLKDNRPLGK